MTNDFKARKNGYRQPQRSPEEYKQFKKEEKEAVYQLVDSAVANVVSSPTEFQKFLDTQARMDRYSAANAFSACALAVAVAVFFLLKPTLGTETTSWICILAAAPFAALGFVKYNGMTAEKFVIAWVKSEFLTPKKLTFKSTNTYYELMKPVIEQKEKEAMYL